MRNFGDHAHEIRAAFINCYSKFERGIEMTDYEFALHQKMISDYGLLDSKREELRARMHAEGKYFVGEENLAKLNGGKIFHQYKGWVK